METIKENEVVLAPGCLDQEIKNGCIEEDECMELGGKVENGVFKAFKDIIYNQLEIDPFSCFMVGPFTALSNFTGKTVSYDVMREAFEELKKTGKFKQGVGGRLSDGVTIACKHFNLATGLKIGFKLISLNTSEIVNAIKSGSPVSTGIKYGPAYFKTEQDDGQIQAGDGVSGKNGHCVTLVKINTTDNGIGAQVKYVENYKGKLKYDIIYIQFDKLANLFFNTGYVFTI